MDFFDKHDIRQIENLELIASQVVEGFIIGMHKSPFHGFSVEFAEHRLYNQGESTRNIDWKVYARTDKMFVKKYEEETNLRCQIVIDTSSSMYFPKEKKLNKLQFSSLAAASLMNLFKRQRDAFGISLFEDNLHTHTPAKSSTKHYYLMLNYLEGLIKNDALSRTTAAAESIHEIADRIHKRSLVIIFSDMLEREKDADELFAALQHLKHNKHEVILFHVLDKSLERDFEYENRPYVFRDMETGEQVKLQSNQVKDLYQEKMQAFVSELKLKCLQYRIDIYEADIKEGFYPILQKFIVRRSKML